MKKLLIVPSLLFLAAAAWGQCIPPTVTATGLPANWPASSIFDPARPVDAPAYFSCANYANSPLPLRSCSDANHTACYGNLECVGLADAARPGQPAACTGPVASGGIRKFVDPLPSIPVATPDTTTYPGSDYYEIELGEYTQQMHSDLPPTRLRGYRQTNMTGTPFQYLGPTIVAQKDRPVRIKFTNKLPTGAGGNLFLPVDTTVMGSGMGPMMGGMTESDPRNPMCGKPGPKPAGCYTENRATLHLHGGITPWISDGTPHQWITPAGESTSYPEGVSVVNVPDMNLCGSATDGCQTFYYTNQQSARLLFYHDHSYGITRLNVYAGEAAPYLITDDAEKALVSKNLIPADQIPLVIQDKTFVPSAKQLATEDPLWDVNRWGGLGSLWLPHVYVPAENPGDSSGANAFGRWVYGPWFWAPTSDITYKPIPNPYYDPKCNADAVGWCEPPLMPGTPNNSMGMEAFNDTPVVNGKAYPYANLAPKKYRFRILNAADDRFLNLQLYVADSTGTEVALKATDIAAAQDDPTVFPTPDTSLSPKGPAWVQIGTEGGFLPAPVVVPNQPITWVSDPTLFNYGNVDKHSLLLGPAERADVILDLTPFAGKTLILYNDAPAAFPARVANYDYYTGHPDMTDTGGAPVTLPGYGPNSRTIMQIRVSGTSSGAAPEDYYDTAAFSALQAAFAHHLDPVTGKPAGVFESFQRPVIVGQGAYNSTYGTSFQYNGPKDGFARIQDFSMTFDTLSGNQLTMPFQPKALHDEMGGVFDPHYGRMSGTLGVELPNTTANIQQFILYGFADPPTEVIDATKLPKSDPNIAVTPISTADDGTQIWKITHNGVDTHAMHFHLYDVQLLNRVGWDGFIRQPDPTELGWKDTIRVSPLEDTIVALRPAIPTVPFDMPNSVRLLDPTMPEGVLLAGAAANVPNSVGFVPAAPNGQPIDIYNHKVNYGWEYVWHCHLLSHEEMDMMRSVAVAAPPRTPTNLALSVTANAATLTWKDNSLSETGFTIQRASDQAFTAGIATFTVGPNVTTYADSTIQAGQTYYYRVSAANTVGDMQNYSNLAGARFPTVTVNSDFSNAVSATLPASPNAPVLTSAAATGPNAVALAWTYVQGATPATSLSIMRSSAGGPYAAISTGIAPANGTFTDTTVTPGAVYSYRVDAVSASGSASSNVLSVTVPLQAPTNVKVNDALTLAGSITINWNSVAGATGYRVTRCLNSAMTSGCSVFTPSTPTFRSTGLTTKTTYYFQVQATNGVAAATSAAAPVPPLAGTTK